MKKLNSGTTPEIDTDAFFPIWVEGFFVPFFNEIGDR